MHRRSITLLPAGGIVLAALLLLACAGKEAAQPNLVLITLDTTRADRLGCYGYFRDTSPNLDAFAGECVLFENCVVPVATTLPTHCSLLTGVYPVEHGVLRNLKNDRISVLDTGLLRTLAGTAEEAGYRTAAFVSGAPLSTTTGIDAGFTVYDQPGGAERTAAKTTDAALAWLAETDGPYLLWVHYYDPHFPFAPIAPYDRFFPVDDDLLRYLEERGIEERTGSRMSPGVSWNTREVNNAYDGEIRYMDEHLGRLLGGLAARADWNETSVLIVGDHGEGLGQHGLLQHGSIWDEQLRAPMLLRAPGLAPRRETAPLSAVDAVPTLLGAAGAGRFFRPLLAQASGRNVLTPSFRPRPVPSQESLRGRESGELAHSLTGRRWKYVREGEGEEAEERLYDLSRDPHELADRAAEEPDTVRALREILEERLAGMRERRARFGDAAESPAALDSARVEQLKALGYVGD